MTTIQSGSRAQSALPAAQQLYTPQALHGSSAAYICTCTHEAAELQSKALRAFKALRACKGVKRLWRV